ncbi:MAG: hypothetical protein M3R00_09205, partial [Pseudomonadota bacterium]|nr:hypothetical protein [Pseudomonadota bacterium]
YLPTKGAYKAMKKTSFTLFPTPTEEPTLKLTDEEIEKTRHIIMKPLEDKAECIIKSKADFEQHKQWLTDNLDERQMQAFTEMMAQNALSENNEFANESKSGAPGQFH